LSPTPPPRWLAVASCSRGFAAEARSSPEPWHEPPKAWEASTDGDAASGSGTAALGHMYTEADVNEWRASFGFAKRQHSLAQIGYTDDELLEWRKPFDELAKEDRIDFTAFEQFVTRKYIGVLPEEMLKEKVQFFWAKFDRDGSNFIDFGEFIVAGLLFDVIWAKERIIKDGIEETFVKYAEDGFMMEPHFFELMCDFRFFVATATDVRKLMRVADKDRDGLVSLPDFRDWVESMDTGLEERKSRKRSGKRAKPLPPPPEPDEE